MVIFILNLYYKSHIGQQLLDKLEMLKVEDRVKQLKLNHVFKMYRGEGPDYLFEHFKKIKNTELKICTRASLHNFFLPRVQSEAMKSFYYSGIKSWNSLPAKIRMIEN